jgi:hypothetical protein
LGYDIISISKECKKCSFNVQINNHFDFDNFDEEVHKRCELISFQAETIIENMKCSLDLALFSLPKEILTMPLKGFLESQTGQKDVVRLNNKF